MSSHYIEEDNLSVAWGRALRLCCARGRSEVVPLIVAITGFDADGNFQEEVSIRTALDAALTTENKQSVHTVANTIFPISLWNRARERDVLFDRYNRILSKLKKASNKNTRGLYFERMITGGAPGRENQLDFALRTYAARKAVRRSVLQVSVFDPRRDHSSAAQLGFPCLQHITFAPSGETLSVNAFYATQYMVERAYGNYVGLCRVGQFAAHEMGLRLSRVTCFTGIAECDFTKGKLSSVLATINHVVGPDEEEEAA